MYKHLVLALTLTPVLFAQCDQWDLLNPNPLPYRYEDLLWDGSRFVSVQHDVETHRTMVSSSPDGMTWDQHFLDTRVAGNIAFNGEKYMVIGYQDFLAVSTDLKHWEYKPYAGTHTFSLAAGDGFWIALSHGLLYRSDDDGDTWTQVTFSGTLHEVRKLGDHLVAVGMDALILTSTDGLTWTTVNSGGSELADVVWDGSTYVAGTWLEFNVYTSTDLEHWTAVDLDYRVAIYSMTHDGSQFILCTGTNFSISPDGFNWKPITSGAPGDTTFWAMTSNGTRALAGTYGGALYTSDNTYTWTPHQTSIINADLNKASAIPGHAVAFEKGSTAFLHSTNATSWTQGSFSATGYDMTSLGDTFILGANNGKVGFSDDGQSWTYEAVGGTRSIEHVAANDALILAVNNAQEVYVRPSTGGSWEQRANLPGPINGIAAGPTHFLAVADAGIVYRSPDGQSWQQQTVMEPVDLNDVTYNGGFPEDVYIIVGDFARVYYSTNGVDWSIRRDRTGTLFSVHHTGERFLVGGENQLLQSRDGLTWTETPGNGAGFDWRAISSFGTTAFAVSDDGVLAVADCAEDCATTITEQPRSQALCQGDPLVLTVMAENIIAYQWRRDGVDIPDANAATYEVTVPDLNDAGVYTCVMTSDCQSLTSQAAEVTFTIGNPGMSFDAVGQGLEPVILSYEADCALIDGTVTWYRDDDNVILAADVTSLLIDPPPLESTRYRVEIADPFTTQTYILTSMVLVSDNAIVQDANGDGCNTPEDLHFVARDWNSALSDYDADGNPGLDIRDLLYINTTGAPCTDQ